MVLLEDFMRTVTKAYMEAKHDTTEKEVMIMDVDGELFGFKHLDYDAENNCWIISLEE